MTNQRHSSETKLKLIATLNAHTSLGEQATYDLADIILKQLRWPEFQESVAVSYTTDHGGSVIIGGLNDEPVIQLAYAALLDVVASATEIKNLPPNPAPHLSWKI